MPFDDSGSSQNRSPLRDFFFKKGGKAPDGTTVLIPILSRFAAAVVALIVVIAIVAGFFIVSPAEQGVMLRFGAYNRTVNPGPHWFPPFVYSRYVVNIQRIDSFPYESQMLTEDENIVSVAVAVQYRVSDPEAYLFNVVGPRNTLQQATSSALRQIVGQMTLNQILTVGRESLRNKVATQLNKTMKNYSSGLAVMDVTLQATKPPREVSAAFNDAVKAREDSQRYINKARAYAKKVLLSTQGRVSRIEQDALAYYQTVTLKAQGKVARYRAFLKPYEEFKVVTKTRLYLDAMTAILSKTTNLIVNSTSQNLMYLPIDQLIKRHSANMSQVSSTRTALPQLPAQEGERS